MKVQIKQESSSLRNTSTSFFNIKAPWRVRKPATPSPSNLHYRLGSSFWIVRLHDRQPSELSVGKLVKKKICCLTSQDSEPGRGMRRTRWGNTGRGETEGRHLGNSSRERKASHVGSCQAPSVDFCPIWQEEDRTLLERIR